MHQALYRKWRPATFDEVCGQEHITGVLKYEVLNNKLSHAYLFCGSRGTGKTSCAKILARAVNCLAPEGGSPCGRCAACRSIENDSATDVIEMDAASNNGVDNIRDIRDEVVYTPSSLKYRVYIIDEVHMLSPSAFNALLKTLEEPPEHVIFILATTELHKLPATIISRCQRFEFRRITSGVLKSRLMQIASSEGIDIDESAAQLIARHAQGGMRDAISLLELCAGARRKIDDALVHESIGSSGRVEMIRLCDAVINKNFDSIFDIISNAVNSSRDLKVFWGELLSLYRDLLIVKTASNPSDYLDLTDSETAELKALASRMSQETISYHCALVEEAYIAIQKSDAVKRIIAELTLVRMCEPRLLGTTQAMLDRISDIEQKLKNISAGTAVFNVPNASAEKPAAEKKRKAGKAPVGSDDDDMFKSDAPPKKSTSVTSVSDISEKRVLKPFRGSAEILEKFGLQNPMNSAFFYGSKWYIDADGRIIIKFASDSSIHHIKTFGAYEEALSVISSVLGKRYDKSTVLLECDGRDSENDIIDEIVSNFEG